MMKIGLQFAMPAELHALPGARDWTPFETVSGVPFFEAEPGILACAGGVGKVNAAAAAQLALARFNPEVLLNVGVAGALHAPMQVAEVYRVRAAVQYDFDLAAINGTSVGTTGKP